MVYQPEMLPGTEHLHRKDDQIDQRDRERPTVLVSASQEVAFVFGIAISQLLYEYFMGGFTVLAPSMIKRLDYSPDTITWPVSIFGLAIAAFIIPCGRLVDIYGGYTLYIVGTAWMCISSLAAGFSQNGITLNVCRAMQGLGAAAYLPAGLHLMGRTYKPGRRKNITFSIYGAMAPLGFSFGAIVAALAPQIATWSWFFWIGACVDCVAVIIAYFASPTAISARSTTAGGMDWIGSISSAGGLALTLFAVLHSNCAPSGWCSPSVYLPLLFGLVLLVLFFYIEGWVAEHPLLPFSIFKIENIRPLAFTVLFNYGTIAIYLLYITL